jgi:hypothetical protein
MIVFPSQYSSRVCLFSPAGSSADINKSEVMSKGYVKFTRKWFSPSLLPTGTLLQLVPIREMLAAEVLVGHSSTASDLMFSF